jgi:hypothetical protein
MLRPTVSSDRSPGHLEEAAVAWAEGAGRATVIISNKSAEEQGIEAADAPPNTKHAAIRNTRPVLQ